MSDNLQHCFHEVGGLIFLVFPDCGDDSQVFRADINQHDGIEVYFVAFLSYSRTFQLEDQKLC